MGLNIGFHSLVTKNIFFSGVYRDNQVRMYGMRKKNSAVNWRKIEPTPEYSWKRNTLLTLHGEGWTPFFSEPSLHLKMNKLAPDERTRRSTKRRN